MAFAITQNCCTDASCLSVCPVNCIHPTPDEPDFGSTEMLYVDPRACIDCGACADACPVDAASPVGRLTGARAVFVELNAAYYSGRPADTGWDAPRFPAAAGTGGLRVAVVGTGPSAGYALEQLVRVGGAKVTVLDRLTEPGGLVRFGVAPDHPETKRIGEHFGLLLRHPDVDLRLGVEVGDGFGQISHADLLAHHDAVVYAVGAAADRALGIDGEQLPGSLAVRTLIGWYNGHPDIPAAAVDLRGVQRVVLVGTGNVALDAVRILLSDPDDLAGTAIAPHALAALRESDVREVVLVARRGPESAAWTRPEMIALCDRVEVVVDCDEATAEQIRSAAPGQPVSVLAQAPVRTVDLASPPAPGRRLVVRFDAVPQRVAGEDRARGLVVATLDGGERLISARLVLRAIGYRSEPVPGLPFDEARYVVPHESGRVFDPVTGRPRQGTYVVGWIKRGPSGGIGTNRACSIETVDALLADAAAGRLNRPVRSGRSFGRRARAAVSTA